MCVSVCAHVSACAHVSVCVIACPRLTVRLPGAALLDLGSVSDPALLPGNVGTGVPETVFLHLTYWNEKSMHVVEVVAQRLQLGAPVLGSGVAG